MAITCKNWMSDQMSMHSLQPIEGRYDKLYVDEPNLLFSKKVTKVIGYELPNFLLYFT
jgi:hypothetical protein